MTQARRVNKFGRDYFKLLDSSRPWIVGAVDDQKFTVTEVVDGKNVMYRSDDNNNKFYNWVSDWFEKYDKELSKQIEAVKNLKSEKYQKAYKAATEISKAVDDRIEIDGSFDVNLWYSYDNDTKTSVITKNIPYKEMVTVAQKETTDSSSKDIIVRSLKQPSCISAKEKDNTIVIDIEKELGVEIVGDTKVKIAIEEDEEPWDEIPEDVTDDTMKEIDDNVDPNYIKEEK